MKTADTGAWVDFGHLSQTRIAARATGEGAAEQKAAALRDVARQFEGTFINMMLDAMRSATPGDPMFGSSEADNYRDLLDHQLSLEMADSGGIGLADMLVRQLSPLVRQASGSETPDNPFAAPATSEAVAPSRAVDEGAGDTPAEESAPAHRLDDRRGARDVPLRDAEQGGWRLVEEENVRVYALRSPGDPADVTTLPVAGASGSTTPHFDGPESFVQQVWPHAKRVAARIGVEPGVLVAQAALETGWGQHIMRTGEGVSSHNLFGIKADERWQGASVSVMTLEHENGVMNRVRAPFRAYDSLAESFNDYAEFVTTQTRYRDTLEAARAAGGDGETYIRSLQGAGYATDPRYAEKVLDVMRRTLAAVGAADNATL